MFDVTIVYIDLSTLAMSHLLIIVSGFEFKYKMSYFNILFYRRFLIFYTLM